jgi:hypothetical protein
MTREELDALARQYEGCVSLRRARSNGRVVGMYRAQAAGIDADAPWALICEDHGSILTTDTRAIAVSYQPHPEEWCDDCREAFKTTKQRTDR